MPRKKKPTSTDAQLAKQAEAAHHEQVTEHLPENPAAPIIESLAESTRVPTELEATQQEVADAVAKVEENTDTPLHTLKPNFAAQEQARRMHGEPKGGVTRAEQERADPWDSHGVRWADGYGIRIQESDSRATFEIQFGDGSKKDQPLAFEKIKPFLISEGLRWNAKPGIPGNAWEIELRVPPKTRRESFTEKEDRVAENKAIRTRIEEVVFPTVVAMEEEKRGQLDLVDETRQRIQRAVSGGSGRA